MQTRYRFYDILHTNYHITKKIQFSNNLKHKLLFRKITISLLVIILLKTLFM